MYRKVTKEDLKVGLIIRHKTINIWIEISKIDEVEGRVKYTNGGHGRIQDILNDFHMRNE